MIIYDAQTGRILDEDGELTDVHLDEHRPDGEGPTVYLPDNGRGNVGD